MKRILASLLIALPLLALASDPAWWTDAGNGTAIIDANFTGNTHITNYAPANLGQLKFVAAQAKKHLDQQLASVGGSGPAITSLVNGFVTNSTYNYSPANLGQLKAVAQPFYDRLIAVQYNTTLNLIQRGFPGNYTGTYPWNPATNVSVNYAPANLGQLKIVFSFDLTGAGVPGEGVGGTGTGGNNSIGYTVPVDLNVVDDGIPDKWKVTNGFSPFDPNLAYEKLDSDGYTIAQAYADGLNPGNTSGNTSGNLSYDSDGDGYDNGVDALVNDPDFYYPRQPVPQYAVLDFGPGIPIDVNDEGDLLFDDLASNGTASGNCSVWSQGSNCTILYNADLTWMQLA
ncbi:MAG: hypothetical protein ABSH19_02695, partial [Opitutales bacterium]